MLLDNRKPRTGDEEDGISISRAFSSVPGFKFRVSSFEFVPNTSRTILLGKVIN